jgi:hypothetical protein
MNGTAAAAHILVPGRDRYSNQHVDVHYAGGGKLRFRRANGGGWEMRRTQADNSARFEPTQLVAGVLADLREHGPSTTKAIAERVGMTTRAASNVLTWLRGLRYVSDGSTSTPIAGGFAHTPAKSPITWTALP